MCADHLFYVSRADIFEVYPRILREILLGEELNKVRNSAKERIIDLPSDFEWQLKMYFRLLEHQKQINQAVEQGIPLESLYLKREQTIWDPITPEHRVSPRGSPGDSQSILDVQAQRPRICPYGDGSIEFQQIDEVNLWGLEEYAKAGKLLSRPPIPVNFIDEHEMRKVYSLIYDVFRYKLVLNQTLQDSGFFTYFPELTKDLYRVWLLLFELYLRKFRLRDPVNLQLKDVLFKEANLLDIERKLYECKIKLAASITRLRVQNNALHLSQLLPIHLQDANVAIAVSYPVLTGWINTFKLKTKHDANTALQALGLYEAPSPRSKLQQLPGLKKSQFRWDKLCPQFVSCYPFDRSKFTRHELLLNNHLIIQNRNFSIGPAIFVNLLDYFDIEGDVAQTHICSPRSTAYIACLLRNFDRVKCFRVFGAGSHQKEYRNYFANLGIDNIKVYAENFIDMSATSMVLDTVVGVLASPPCSYSGISDPIDLICSRGGDLTMLEVLSESEMTNEGKSRVAQVLEEQRNTLKKAMSRPQTQFILYLTHSIVDTENEEMVHHAIELTNKRAKEKHVQLLKEKARQDALAALEQGFSLSSSKRQSAKVCDDPNRPDSGISAMAPSVTATKMERIAENDDPDNTGKEPDSLTILEEVLDNVEVPPSDQFESIEIPDVCENRDSCLDFKQMGCFMALIKRKEVVQLDSKYLIKIAEARGIFGDNNAVKKPKSKAQKRAEREAEKAREVALQAERMKRLRRRGSNLNILIDRLNAPTIASIKRAHYQGISVAAQRILFFNDEHICQRHACRHADNAIESGYITSYPSGEKPSRAKTWWLQTLKHLRKIRLLIMGHDGLALPELVHTGMVHFVAPLKFDRMILMGSPAMMLRKNVERTIYPVSIRQLQFQEVYKSEDNIAHCSCFKTDDDLDARKKTHPAFGNKRPRRCIKSSASCWL